MNPRLMLNRVIIFLFMVLVGYSLAKAFQTQSVIAILLSLVSLGAGIYFLYLLGQIKKEREESA